MSKLLITLILGAAVMSAETFPKQNGKLEGISKTLLPIGEIDGKTYYAETTYMPWQEAVGHCSRQNDAMALASITTTFQMDFLKQAYDNETFSGDFWTSGRDAVGPGQYTWHNSGTIPGNFLRFAGSRWYQTCLALRSVPNNGSKLYGVHCEQNRLRPLCELYMF